MIPVGTAVGYLTLDYTNFSKNLNTAINEATGVSGRFSETFGKGLTTVGNQISSVGKTLTTGLTVPLGTAAASSVKFGAEFDKQMSSVKAVSNATIEELNAMRDAAISWGEKTVYSATEAGEALYYMGLAGWEPQKSIAALGSVLNLAAAGDLELGRTSDIVTDAMTAMGYEAGELTNGIENTAYFSNVLAATMSNSNTTVDLLGESFKYVAPLAGSLKSGMDDLGLALGLMANVGVKGTQAGTGLRQALKNLIAPTDKMKAAMKEYGVSLFDAQGNAKDMRTFMEELRDTFGDLELSIYDSNGELKTGEQIMEEYGHSLPTTQQEKLNAIVEIFGTRALPGILGIIDQSDEKFNNLADAIDNSSQAFVEYEGVVYTMSDAIAMFGEEAIKTQEGFKILGAAEGQAMMQMDNLQGDWTRFTSALGTSKILITDLVKGQLREFVQRLTELIQKFNSLDEEQKKHILKIAAVIAAIGPALLVFGKFVAGIGNVITGFHRMSEAFSLIKSGFVMLGAHIKNMGEAFTLARAGFSGIASQTSILAAALGSITGPVIAVIAVIALLTAAFVHLWKNNEDFRNKITEIWNGIVDKFTEAGQKITDAINSLGFDFSGLGEAIKAAWDWICNALAPIITGIFGNISRMIGGVVDIVVGIFQTIAGVIKGFKDGDWSLFIEGIKTLWNGFWSIITAPFVAVFDILTGYLESFGLTWSDVWNAIKDFFVNLWNTIKDFFVDTWDKIKSSVTEKVENTKTSIIEKFVYLRTKIISIIVLLKEGVVEKIEELKLKFTTTVENIKTAISNKFTEMKNSVIDTITSLKSKAETKMREVKEGLINVFSNIKQKFEDVGKNIIEGIKNGISSGWDALTGWVSEKAESLLAAAKNTLGIHSPSKRFADEVGEWLPPGIALGFSRALPKAIGSMESTLDKGLDKFDVREIDIVGLSDTFKSVVTDVADWFTSLEERLSNTVNDIKTDLANLIGIGQLVIGSDGTISGIVVDNKKSSSLEVSTPGKTPTSNGETVNNFTFYSNEPIDEIKAAKLLKETQRDLAEGYL